MLPVRHPIGWIPDRPDHRDLHLEDLPASPSESNMRLLCSEVVDDGSMGACSASAVTGAMELLARKAGRPALFSRSFLYFQTRVLMGVNPTLDTGASLRDALKVLYNVGVCLESTWTSGPEHLSAPPSEGATLEASRFKISSYHGLGNLDHIKAALSQGTPVVGGFSLPGSALLEDVARSGIIRFPSDKEGFFGGHAVLFVGYDSGFLLFKNSWGPAWGEVGYGRLDERFVSRGLARDLWAVTL